jgi:hypothetical protein
MPVKNRFPESAVDDEDGDGIDSSGSEPDYAIEEAASDIGMQEDEDAASNGGGTAADGSELPPRPNTNLWSLRDPSTSMWNKPLTPNSRPGLDMDVSGQGYLIQLSLTNSTFFFFFAAITFFRLGLVICLSLSTRQAENERRRTIRAIQFCVQTSCSLSFCIKRLSVPSSHANESCKSSVTLDA